MRAFWTYDLFPFVLSGTITHEGIINGKTIVETREFGGGSHFKPFLILDNKRGKELKENLWDLEREQKDALNKLNIKYNKKLNKLLKGYGYDPSNG